MKEDPIKTEGFTYLSYRYRTGSGVRDFETDSITEIVVSIEASFDDSRDQTKNFDVSLGTLKAIRVHAADALEEGLNLFDIFDTTEETHAASEDLFDESYTDFDPLILEAYEDAWFCQDLLLIQEITVKPFARGQRVGASALYRFMKDHMAGCSFVVLKPYPLQISKAYESPEVRTPLALDEFSQNQDTATRKLEEVYSELGFEKLKGMTHMVKPVCYEDTPDRRPVLRDSVTLHVHMLEELGK